MDAPKCRLCGARHYGQCPPGSFGQPYIKKEGTTMCRIGCNAETYLARIAVLEAKLAKLQGIKRKPAPRTAMPLQAGIKRLYPGYSTPAPAAKKTKRKPK